jgi:uncharacterized protein YggE
MKGNMIRLASVMAVAMGWVLALTVWTSGAESSDPEGSGSERSITVTGDADVLVAPDEVVLTLGVETWDKKMEQAKSQNDRIVASVMALVSEHGIPSKHIQTDYVSIEPRYRNGYYEERDFVGYFVRKNIVVTLRDLDQFESLLTGALDAGANHVHGIEFRTTQLRTHKDKARALATGAAEEKAAALAGELGQRLGEPMYIEEVHSQWWSGYGSWWYSAWGSAMAQNVVQDAGGGAILSDATVAPGQIRINAKVRAVFSLVD